MATLTASIPERRRFNMPALALEPYLYVLPALVILLAFVYWPILYSVWLSVHAWDFLRPVKPFVGLENYTELLGSDDFWNSLTVTAIFVIGSVPVRLLLALALAHALMRETGLHRLARGAFFLPVITSSVALSIIWSWMFNTDYGLINGLITTFGGGKVSWLTSTEVAIWSIVIVNVWKQLGYDLIIYLAGLQAIPSDYYEAAKIDGASGWQRFRALTLPLLMPTTFFLLVVSVIDSFQVFTIVNVMTQGGPAWSTDLIVNLLYRTSFIVFDIGLGSALAMILFLILMGLTVAKFAVIGRKVYYEYQ
ncbi:MAG: carbohydrate ABC transporter permease [Geminicoccaceae bacterium]